MAGLKERYRQHHAAILHRQTAYDVVMAEDQEDDHEEGGDITSEQSPERREQAEEEGHTHGQRNEQHQQQEKEALPDRVDSRRISPILADAPPKVCQWHSVPTST